MNTFETTRKGEKYRLRQILKWVKGNYILDMGSYGIPDSNDPDILLHDFLKQSLPKKNIIGVDIIEGENVDFIIDFDRTPYPIKSKSYETIVAGEIIEHLARPFEFLKECHRILKPKGRLIITTPNMTSIIYLLNKMECGDKHPHCQAWSPELFKCLLKKTKFKILHEERFNFYRNHPVDFCMNIFTNIFPVLKTNMLFVIEKRD